MTADRSHTRVVAVAGLVAALLAAPAPALRELKPLLRRAVTSSRDEQLRHEREAQGRLMHALVTARHRG